MKALSIRLRTPAKTLKKAGYNKYSGGYELREKTQGRFHGMLKGPWYVFHYDLFVENKHSVFHMPMKLREERDRLIELDRK